MASTETLDRTDWTYDEYLKLDDEQRYEIFEGDLSMAPAPDSDHQKSVGDLFVAMKLHVADRGLGEVFVAPLDVVLDDRNVVQPDILFVSKEREGIVQKRGIAGAPDLVVEIISPGSLRRDRHLKLKLYERFRVREYWIVDPANRSVEVLELKEGRYDLESFAVGTGRVVSKVISEFELPVETLFSEQPGA